MDEHAELRQLLNKLYEAGSLSFSEVASCLTGASEKGHSDCWQYLSVVSGGFDLFYVRNKETGKWIGKAKPAFSNPELYEVIVDKLEEGERNLSRKYNWAEDPNNQHLLADGSISQGLLRHDTCRFFGNPSEAINLREHLIHFSEFFGAYLISRGPPFESDRFFIHDELHSNFSNKLRSLLKANDQVSSYSVDRVIDVYLPDFLQ